jgi:hypothetical protein
MKRNRIVINAMLLLLIMVSFKGYSQNTGKDQPGKNTNSFFDNDTLFDLPLPGIWVGGEVLNPGKVSLDGLPLKTVIVKEALSGKDGVAAFTGAYCYEGYALTDILNPFLQKKANAAVFPPLTDLYVEITNRQGDTVVLSWGELYYSNRPDAILIATRVMRIVPDKTQERWPLPDSAKLVVPGDLLTERNISMPTSITIKSCSREIPVIKGKFPMHADTVVIDAGRYGSITLTTTPEGCPPATMHTIFYGKGRGLHSTEPFTGSTMQCVLSGHIPLNRQNLRGGLVLFCADDGYRAVFSLSELVNRNDQQQTLLLFTEDDGGDGRFRVFPSCDFFSDRAVRGLNRIWFSVQSI